MDLRYHVHVIKAGSQIPWLCVFQCELQELKSDLYEAQSTSAVLNKELQHLVLQLHSAQLQVSAQMGHAGDSTAIKQKLVSTLSQASA